MDASQYPLELLIDLVNSRAKRERFRQAPSIDLRDYYIGRDSITEKEVY